MVVAWSENAVRGNRNQRGCTGGAGVAGFRSPLGSVADTLPPLVRLANHGRSSVNIRTTQSAATQPHRPPAGSGPPTSCGHRLLLHTPDVAGHPLCVPHHRRASATAAPDRPLGSIAPPTPRTLRATRLWCAPRGHPGAAASNTRWFRTWTTWSSCLGFVRSSSHTVRESVKGTNIGLRARGIAGPSPSVNRARERLLDSVAAAGRDHRARRYRRRLCSLGGMKSPAWRAGPIQQGERPAAQRAAAWGAWSATAGWAVVALRRTRYRSRGA